MEGAVWGGAVGIGTWVVTNAIGSPILKFFNLRTEVRRTLILYGNVRARWHERDLEDFAGEAVAAPGAPSPLSAEDEERLAAAQLALRELAADMRAFADTLTLASWLLKRVGYDARAASAALMGLSNSIDKYGATRHEKGVAIRTALRLPPD
jgi:hypothetical protein